jgi:hypothetical protein
VIPFLTLDLRFGVMDEAFILAPDLVLVRYDLVSFSFLLSFAVFYIVIVLRLFLLVIDVLR